MTPRPHWDDERLYPRSDSPRTRRYRRLQSWYREVQLGVAPGAFGTKWPQLASMLDAGAVAEQPDLNFLHPSAFEHAEQRIDEARKDGSTLAGDRLRRNMLSSMPLCFNLFGAMRGEYKAFFPVFQELFDPAATALTEVICEWPPRDEPDRLPDRTAFDAVVLYRAGEESRFFGIETKYTEPFSQSTYKNNDYETPTAASPWFRANARTELLRDVKANQLWRNVLLAAGLDQGAHGRGSVAVVALADDRGAGAAMNVVSSQLSDAHADRLRSVPLETIVETTRRVSPSLTWWADSFERRYLFTDLDGRIQDPSGPRSGQTLTETASSARGHR